ALAEVDTLEKLQAFPTGSGAQWSTRSVMEQAGFQVVTSEDYEALFKMLKLRRFLTFGRGINEVFKEQESFVDSNQSLIVEKTLCLFIPLPTYFFVSPAHPDLARLIEIGLKQMIADGSFDRHFLDFHHADLSRANLSKRKIFAISNPNLSGQTPVDEPSYWLDPASFADMKRENDS
ncbi:MAG: amino acid ABC transporter substrate-binding protein, partial [Pseudomonadota bacterium]